ncbi:MAG: FG-GAP-like repeat-containing protein [Planctomycetales bacterium]
MADQYLQDNPDSTDALLVAGRACEQAGDIRLALAYYRRAVDEFETPSIEALVKCSELTLDEGGVVAAEHYLRRTLALDSGHLRALHLLIFLLRVEGRYFEIRPFAYEAMRQGQFDLGFLVPLSSPENAPSSDHDDEVGRYYYRANPDNLLPLLGDARQTARRNRGAARAMLEDIVARHPEQLEAQAQLGLFLISDDELDAFGDWHRQLPSVAGNHPEIWHCRGLWAAKQKQIRAAARCFWEALLLHPDHKSANFQLAQVLASLGSREQAQVFARRAGVLEDLEYSLFATGFQRGFDLPDLRPVVLALEKLDRLWEAQAWCKVAIKNDPKSDWVSQVAERLEKKVSQNHPLTMLPKIMVGQLHPSTFPLPDWIRVSPQAGVPELSSIDEANVTFKEVAVDAGIEFQYFNGAPPDSQKGLIYELSAGGVAAVDFDADAWPDLYLTQGCESPVKVNSTLYTDRLFRNSGDGHFDDVSDQSGLGNEFYGQGVSAGDVDNDGFSDIYVANFGSNRLYVNNGDGTFDEVTPPSVAETPLWTSSCLICDLNGDTFPDLYDVNYLDGPEVLTRTCVSQNGAVQQCMPAFFPAAQDHVYQSTGDGSFSDVTMGSGIVSSHGRGLGAVAGDIDDSGRISLFVVNDTTANSYFVNASTQRGQAIAFSDQGLISGLAFGRLGEAQACMGIAARDADGNGTTDFYVTNFVDESNNLYLGQLTGGFVDSIKELNLYDTSFPVMGWGTQFLDADLDGDQDLVVANGGLDILKSHGSPYLMPTQYYRNSGGRFDLVPASQLGGFFSGQRVSRSVARLDWNRDGLEEFCVTHVDAPFSLLVNRTETDSHFLSILLKGVTCDRDAIGARVEVVAGNQSWTQQTMAGDGFQACNERRMVFGLGDHDSIEQITVHWPNGGKQVFQSIEADKNIVLVEGRNSPVSIE